MGFNKGKFGSSAARANWRLLRVMLGLWIVIVVSGAVLHLCLGTPWWLTCELYLVGLASFHIWHWAAHQRWLLYPMWKVHMFHHWKVYPPKRFLAREYKNDKEGRTPLTSLAHDGPLYAMLLGNAAALYAGGYLPRTHDVAVALASYAAVGSFFNWLHHALHVEGHCVERLLWFHDLRALHYTHHQGTAKHNFGFIDFAGDILGDSMEKPDYALSNSASAGRGGKDGQEEEKEAVARAAGTGDEHKSKVKPGALPTLAADGPKECAFVGTCFVIEGLVGVMGFVFGAAKDERGAATSKQALAAPSIASEVLGTARDMLLFS